jgi:MYXO-CTERM domain-containing protein
VGGSSSTGGQVERGDAGSGDAGGIFNRIIDNGAGLVGQHVGLKSLKCSVGVPRGAHTHMTTLIAAGAVAGLGGMRRRRRAKKR